MGPPGESQVYLVSGPKAAKERKQLPRANFRISHSFSERDNAVYILACLADNTLELGAGSSVGFRCFVTVVRARNFVSMDPVEVRASVGSRCAMPAMCAHSKLRSVQPCTTI